MEVSIDVHEEDQLVLDSSIMDGRIMSKNKSKDKQRIKAGLCMGLCTMIPCFMTMMFISDRNQCIGPKSADWSEASSTCRVLIACMLSIILLMIPLSVIGIAILSNEEGRREKEEREKRDRIVKEHRVIGLCYLTEEAQRHRIDIMLEFTRCMRRAGIQYELTDFGAPLRQCVRSIMRESTREIITEIDTMMRTKFGDDVWFKATFEQIDGNSTYIIDNITTQKGQDLVREKGGIMILFGDPLVPITSDPVQRAVIIQEIMNGIMGIDESEE